MRGRQALLAAAGALTAPLDTQTSPVVADSLHAAADTLRVTGDAHALDLLLALAVAALLFILFHSRSS